MAFCLGFAIGGLRKHLTNNGSNVSQFAMLKHYRPCSEWNSCSDRWIRLDAFRHCHHQLHVRSAIVLLAQSTHKRRTPGIKTDCPNRIYFDYLKPRPETSVGMHKKSLRTLIYDFFFFKKPFGDGRGLQFHYNEQFNL